MSVPPDKLQVLRDRIASAASPAERVEATLKLAEQLWLSDPVAAKPLLEQVVAEADAAGRPKDGGRAAYMLGELVRRAGDLDGAARYAEMVFKVADATGDRRVRASWLNLAGIIHEERGDIQSAHVRATVHDAVGRQVACLDAGEQQRGTHRLSWSKDSEGRRLSTGAYFVLLDMGTGQIRLKAAVK